MTTTATHTPGPWIIHHLDGVLDIRAVELDGTTCFPCRVNGDATDSEYGETTWANARLIAAAPDLLAAAERMVRDQDRPVFSMDFKGAVDALRAAIEKATR